jgi:hypothetical protein
MKLPPSKLVAAMSAETFKAATDPLLTAAFSKRVQKCLQSRQKREDKTSQAAVKDREFCTFIHGSVTPQGVWLSDLTTAGKESFGEKYCTRTKIERLARQMPDVTLRRIKNADKDELALFIGTPITPLPKAQEQHLNLTA